MRELSIREMREALGRLDEILDDEGEVVITRYGSPVARVLPIRGARQLPSHRRLRENMPYLETPSALLVRLDRDER